MPVGPLVDAALAWIERHGLTLDAAGARFGVDEKTIRRWRDDRGSVRLSDADSVLVAIDLLWFDVWDPAVYPEVAAIWEGE